MAIRVCGWRSKQKRVANVGAGHTGSSKAPSSLKSPLAKYSYEAQKKQPSVQGELDAARDCHKGLCTYEQYHFPKAVI